MKTRAKVPEGSGTPKASDYTLNRWPAQVGVNVTVVKGGHLTMLTRDHVSALVKTLKSQFKVAVPSR